MKQLWLVHPDLLCMRCECSSCDALLVVLRSAVCSVCWPVCQLRYIGWCSVMCDGGKERVWQQQQQQPIVE